ncbi:MULTISPECIES: restriction endonuclease [unclassified Rhizobacter]|uniref:restriction endonuclease n=1 Tax=unclassified Rhizobacter TaxID=2640088 RepID=UPI0009114ABD|nr:MULTISPECIES: restriction endonuclease [unclassified Rhizobacter]SHN40334.1 Restriction endonuclease [Rhizobacter sp. OV335]
MTSNLKEPVTLEKLVAELLERMGREGVKTNLVVEGSLGHRYDVDIIFGDLGDATIVEVKAYRYHSPPPAELLVRALNRLQLVQKEMRVAHLMLVMSCPLVSTLLSISQHYPNVEIWDGPKLLEVASYYPDLLKRLEDLLEVTVSDVGIRQDAEAEIQSDVESTKGRELASELRAIPPGREGAYIFEQKCVEALQYLFDRDLFGWHIQHTTEDGLHRRDLVCRILPKAEIWRLMLTDLKSRYVVFEFKNYSEQISQSEIITTERYLYPSALRRLAIIVSPRGCSSSANKVIQGAMRESGKLLLSLTVDELASLLVGKDEGSDPNSFLFERVDEFLISLGR